MPQVYLKMDLVITHRLLCFAIRARESRLVSACLGMGMGSPFRCRRVIKLLGLCFCSACTLGLRDLGAGVELSPAGGSPAGMLRMRFEHGPQTLRRPADTEPTAMYIQDRYDYICIYTYIFVSVFMHTEYTVFIYIYICVYIYIFIYFFLFVYPLCMYIHIYIYKCLFVYLFMYFCLKFLICIYICM